MKNEMVLDGFDVQELSFKEEMEVDGGWVTWAIRAGVALTAWAAKDVIDHWDHFKAGVFLEPQPK